MTDNKMTVLIVEDDESNRISVSNILLRERYNVLSCESGSKALEILKNNSADLLLTDLKMENIDGIELLNLTKDLYPDIEVVLMTAHGTVETAVQAMKKGAYDFITKPFKRMELLKAVKKGLEKKSLTLENRFLKKKLSEMTKDRLVIGSSLKMKSVMDQVMQVAKSSATVLIEGESGTGKELIAEAIHDYSDRNRKPLLKISCAAIPETLLEAELFGYEKGAFTGAVSKKEGKFEAANNGTIFLDEISEMNQSAQVKVLRILQKGEFEHLGSNKVFKADVRIISATNKNLEEEILKKSFREDLFYRLNVIKINIPPLRERMEDILLLSNHFIKIYCAKNKKPFLNLSKEALDVFNNYNWPGNVRELENVIERAVVLAKTKKISIDHISASLLKDQTSSKKVLSFTLGTPMQDVERKMIDETLKFTKGDKERAAKILGIASRTIYRRLGNMKES